MHLRLEIGRWWIHIGREPEPQPETQPPPFIEHLPTPQTVYTPDFVGFVKLSDPEE